MNNYFFKVTLVSFLGMSYTGTLISGNNSFAEVRSVPENAKHKTEVSGVIKDAETGASLSGVNIYIKELRTGTSTNDNGLFLISLPQGDYTFRISCVGYKTKTEHISVSSSPLKQNFSLDSDTKLDEVVVYANKKDQNVTSTNMGVEKLSINQIRKMPALMGEVDVIKAIQLLPGVQATSEGGSGYSVRGGSADQNLILLDNATVYNASHMFGFFSVFNNDVVNNVELYKGDLPMKYGGRLSSLLDVQLKEDYTGKVRGSGGLGLISSRLMMEGGIGKKTSWMIGGRRSYADLFLKLSSDKSLRESSIYFYDLNAKITHRFSPKDRLSLNTYIGKDNFGSSVGQFNYGNRVASLTWGHGFNEKLYSKLSMNATNYHYTLQSKMSDSKVKWNSDITDVMLRWDLDHTLSDELKIAYGVSSAYHNFNPGLITRPNYPDYKMPLYHALEHGVYVSAEQKFLKNFTVKYGLRLSAFQNMGSVMSYSYNSSHVVNDSTYYGSGKIYHTYYALEPRVGMVYKITDNSSFKANYARNTQFIQLANSSSSGSPLDLWFPCSPNVKPQRVDMFSTGYFRNFNKNEYETSVEVYYKKMNNVVDFADHAQLLLNSKLEGEIRVGTGKAYGVEFMVRKNTGKLTGFLNYTLSRSERTIPEINEGKTYLSPYDKTHCVNLSLSYELSKKWNISANWVYSTGNPTTYPTGRFEVNGEYFPIYSGRNEYRRTDYHRLDLSANYVPKHDPHKFWTGEWNFSLYNAYGHKNPWIITYDQNTPSGVPDAKMTYLFGAVPSITYNFKF